MTDKRLPEINFPKIPEQISPELKEFFVQLREYIQKIKTDIMTVINSL
jgi:hypothetical protein